MNYYLLMFIMLLMSSTLISITASSWMTAWLGLEINMLSIITLMKNPNKSTSQEMIKYFTVQATASLMLMASMIFYSSKLEMFNLEHLFMLMASSMLLMKMGMVPFHFWFPEVIAGNEWKICLLLMTLQKMAPSILLSFIAPSMTFISIIITTSILVSSVQSMDQTCLRKLLAYSSINNTGWMLPLIFMNLYSWITYFMIYTIITMSVILTLKNSKIMFISQMNKMFHSNKNMKMFFSLSFMSMGGLPPFLGFLPKWMVVKTLVMNNMAMLATMMVILTLPLLFTYLRMIINNLSITTSESMKINYNHQLSLMNMLTVYGLPIGIIMF
uniref:NADH-ubiquinone oxidoreductase chain 2 n=1 Tax=Hypothenemus sp. BMNH 1039866 TaxID=1903766 RepID=A0A343A5N5_9CUCU|nr:NADH dehydrogenase subunit 2 [Hypothenemus sp. BMNH 1039866]